MAASIGAGISMGFTEALSDNGVLIGHGHPWISEVLETAGFKVLPRPGVN